MYFIIHTVLYYPGSKVTSSPVLPRLIASIVGGSLLRRAHFESLRAAEAKNAATINQLKYRSRSCITGNMSNFRFMLLFIENVYGLKSSQNHYLTSNTANLIDKVAKCHLNQPESIICAVIYSYSAFLPTPPISRATVLSSE